MDKRLTRAPAARVERMALAGGELLAEVGAGTATITLNRPAALNALSYAMLVALRECLDAWEGNAGIEEIVLRGAGDRAFCAGGDVRALYHAFMSGQRDQRAFFEFEYALDLRIHRYPKPITALLDGIVMGGGMGISQGARRRVVGDRTRMAMPETAIGLFPDVGGSYFLSRVPGELGTYLGLLGETIGAADAIYCGLADDYAGSSGPGTARLERLRPAIDRHFAAGSVEAIVDSLAGERDPTFADWASETRESLARRSPTMLKVTLEQLRRGAGLALEQCFRMELDIVQACFEQGDFLEGIRALLVDKDNRPRWRPATLAEVSRADVERFFTPRTP